MRRTIGTIIDGIIVVLEWTIVIFGIGLMVLALVIGWQMMSPGERIPTMVITIALAILIAIVADRKGWFR